MANEWTLGYTATLANGNLKASIRPASFRVSQTTKNGPTPGTVSVTTSGVTVSLSALTAPGVTFITNIDSTNYVSYGLYISSTFYPLGEIGPGETYCLKLARDILTANTAAAVFRMKANTATCICTVQSYDA